ncbi:uncharacterized protein LOC141705170 [Apium graveolens]|uniref:uncharacterized protein LOC141705167 n=1 Tax=Apium graveolens TaxID=4045 RepID=UPI003D794F73
MGSGTNLDNIIAAAHGFHKTKYNKKFNFDKYWNDLKRHPKWRQPKETNNGSAKRTKFSDFGNYSSLMNETPTDENVVESPVRPKGTKAAKRDGKKSAIKIYTTDENSDMSKEFIEEGSSTTTKRVICKDREAGHERLERDYFAQNPVYPLDTFRRRFRMGRHVFLRIVDALSNFDPYFQQKVDALERKGLSPLQNSPRPYACWHMELERMQLMIMCALPNSNEVQRLIKMGKARGFPGMMGSIDYMHLQWKNCPKAWKGMFMRGHKGVPTILLNVVASSDLWI